jgi:hypothetical protein
MKRESNRRRFYRIRYPLIERPWLIASQAEFSVFEISEAGARIKYADEPPAVFSQPIPVRIVFRDGKECRTEAVLERTQYGEFVLRFAKHIPLKVIASEQRRLLRHYPRHVREC